MVGTTLKKRHSSKLLILGYVFILAILAVLVITDAVTINFSTPTHQELNKLTIYWIKNNCIMSYYARQGLPNCNTEWDMFGFTINSTYYISGALNSTNGLSVFILPDSKILESLFWNSITAHMPNYYTYYSGQVKSAQIGVALPAGKYWLVVVNLGPVASNYSFTQNVTATLLQT